MKIGFVNQKGGVGKTTLALMFSHYLEDNVSTPLCLDFDPQSSLYYKWESACRVLSEHPELTVLNCDLEELDEIIEIADSTNGPLLFDLPGSLDHPKIHRLIFNLDLLICPFVYDAISFESTLVFASILKELRFPGEIVFIPNMVKSNVRYDIKTNVDQELRAFGSIAPEVKDWVDMQRLEFFANTKKSQSNVEKTFAFIISKYRLRQ